MDPGIPASRPRARTRSRQLRPGLRVKPILCRPNREERLRRLDDSTLLSLSSIFASIKPRWLNWRPMPAPRLWMDFRCRTRRPACRKQRHQSRVPCRPPSPRPQTDERAKQPNQRTKDRHRGSVSDGNGVHGGFLWCVEEETEQPATPRRRQRRCSCRRHCLL